jgi:hypothetical protein
MGFSAENYTPSSKGGSKILEPGTHQCRIVDVTLQVMPFDKEQKQLSFLLEGLPEGGSFEGVARDKNNPAMGNYEGKIAYVANGQYPFRTWTTKDNKVIERDDQIFNYLMNLARNLGVDTKMKADKFEANTIEEFAIGVKKYICDVWAYFTITGKEYYTEGYTKPNYRCFFPKFDKKAPVALKEEDVLMFNESMIIHTEKGTAVAALEDDGEIRIQIDEDLV